MNGVKVGSIDSITTFRAALWKFLETAQKVMSDADAELQRTVNWLETEADSHWRSEIRRRQDAVTRAKAALRSKKMFKSDLSQRSVVDEEKALRIAEARLEEAQRTLEAVRRYRIMLQKEVDQYKGQVQRFAGAVTIDIPMAVTKIDALLGHLRDYLAIKPAEASGGAAVEASVATEGGTGEPLNSMARPEPPPNPETPPEAGPPQSASRLMPSEDPKATPRNPEFGGAHGHL